MDRQEFLRTIKPGIIPDRNLFLRIYGYDLSFPGFRDFALNELNRSGYRDAWKIYADVVTKYEVCRDDMYRRVAEEILNEEETEDAEYEEVG